ncbi:hypothetical protein MILU53160_08475 [Micrococcus luteus]
MTQPVVRGMSRRSIVRLGAAASALLLVSPDADAKPRDRRVGLTKSGRMTVLKPAGSGEELPRVLGVVLSDGTPAGSVIEFDFDQALYEALPTVLTQGVKQGGHLESNHSDHQKGRARVRLGEAQAGASVVVGVLKQRPYPFDLVRDPSGVRVGGAVSSLDLGAGPRAKASTPWAAESGVQWQTHDWDNRYRYFAPVSASVLNSGFASVPAGGQIVLKADRRIVKNMRIERVVDGDNRPVPGGSTLTNTDGNSFEVRWTIPRALRPGERVMLRVRPEFHETSGEVQGVSLPTVEFISTSSGQRASTFASLTRRDVVCDVADVNAARPL